ncbi:MAG: alpha/beta hydrolase [Ilumatobacter sp.]|uniref:alpha/beta hydrolase n=1 Tax=Ilumatobacter sp. TaxID=1967498 RepID=UPI002611A420|nr:alpha/beta hydrolase [Ilumatobacter sp.]MDJ0769397.1 alpha/beta hydrolase [Ilumatobacter sp.]
MASTEAEAIKVELQAFAEALQTDPPPELDEMRAAYETLGDIGRPPSGVSWTDVDVDGIPAIWADADGGATDRVLLYVHGGGYVIGAAKYYTNLTGHLAKAIGCRVLNLDYRLAPEHPHPAPVEDAVRAFLWLRSQGFDDRHIAIAGDSAGGGLTITTMLSLRDRDLGQPAAAVPISPWGDLEGLGGTMTTNADKDVLVGLEMLQAMAMMFLAGGDAKDPLAAPIYADYSGLAPLYIQVGGDETLLDDTVRIVAKAEEAGVDVTSEVFPEMQHVFQFAAGRMPEADEAVAKIGAYLRPRLGL